MIKFAFSDSYSISWWFKIKNVPIIGDFIIIVLPLLLLQISKSLNQIKKPFDSDRIVEKKKTILKKLIVIYPWSRVSSSNIKDQVKLENPVKKLIKLKNIYIAQRIELDHRDRQMWCVFYTFPFRFRTLIFFLSPLNFFTHDFQSW